MYIAHVKDKIISGNSAKVADKIAIIFSSSVIEVIMSNQMSDTNNAIKADNDKTVHGDFLHKK